MRNTWKVIRKMRYKYYSKTLFWKIKIVDISRSIIKSSIQPIFTACQVEGYQNILKLSCRLLRFISYKTFWKNKKRSRTSLPALFSAWFLKKSIYLVIFYYLTKFHCVVRFTSWDIGQYVYCNCLITRLWCYKFWY